MTSKRQRDVQRMRAKSDLLFNQRRTPFLHHSFTIFRGPSSEMPMNPRVFANGRFKRCSFPLPWAAETQSLGRSNDSGLGPRVRDKLVTSLPSRPFVKPAHPKNAREMRVPWAPFLKNPSKSAQLSAHRLPTCISLRPTLNFQPTTLN